MVCFRYIIVSTLREGVTGDIDYDENNIHILLISLDGEHYFLLLSV